MGRIYTSSTVRYVTNLCYEHEFTGRSFVTVSVTIIRTLVKTVRKVHSLKYVKYTIC